MRQEPELFDIPEAAPERRKRLSLQLVWLIPIVAAVIGGTLVVKTYLRKGPTITISFKTGEGLEAGKTKVKYKDVEVGLVKDVAIAKDITHVVATIELKKEVTPYLVEDTKFWVVRPRVSGGGVSGLGTLMGGSYIGVDVGRSKKPQRGFVGLEVAPAVAMDVPGSRFQLHSADLGSLDIGSPVYFRRIQVGQVVSYQLDNDGSGVSFNVFVAAPYDKYVRANTRFWNASGVDVTMDAGGVKVETQSLASILIGGIAFQTFDESGAAPPTGANTAFTLFATRDEAMKNRDTISQNFVMTFKETVRGLSLGAPVDFRGLTVGEVSGIHVAHDARTKNVDMLVEMRIYPERLRSRVVGAAPDPKQYRAILDEMVGHGLRAQLNSSNLLTGQLVVTLDFFPDAPNAKVNWAANPPLFPTTPGSLVQLQATLMQIAKKLEKLPLNEVVDDVRHTVQTLDITLKDAGAMIRKVDKDLMPEMQTTLEEARKTLGAAKQTLSADAPLQQDLRVTLRELGRTAQSLRVLTDYLERHPESLIRGKQEDKP
ncbi:PqiB family protein [Geomonas azotofigens]|uniref:PqiB family protein n=1 Tax=Geomonas azotofigens TaxID=2843196 RepID=UPI001F1A4160|nr:MlaD family protein [Geomonas azotofigens]